MNYIADLLNAAADRIEPPGAWTQNVAARNDSGNPVNPSSESAKCWCMLGALCKESKKNSDVYKALDIFKRLMHVEVSLFNDSVGRTQGEAVKALRDAAKIRIR